MKIYIETIGCKLNQYESQALSESLQKNGFEISGTMEESDIVIVNTCSVTNKADVKSRQVMRKAKKLGKLVAATGCYATTDFEELNTAGFADIVVKNDSKFNIPDIIKSRINLEKSLPLINIESEFPVARQFERTRAFLKIQDGCDKFCSYCKVPLARGRSRSLDPANVLEFIKGLVQSGYKEIVLTGVNISDYGFNGIRLFHIVKEAVSLPGDFRIRLSSLQPDEFDSRIIDLLQTEKLAPHFHLSIQSGSNSVLKRMNRNYTASYFLELTHKIRQACPDCGITTDIIAGFPEETEEEFQETLNILKEAFFTRVHLFSYSPRSHTRAERMKDVDGNIKKERLKRLEETAIETGKVFVKNNILGKNYRVLIETKEAGLWTGYTPNYIKIHTERECTENEFIDLKACEIRVNKGLIELLEK